ncbi:MAG: preprotein translocase subunit YajC [Clostridia bacterium]
MQGLQQFLPIIIMFAIFYFLLIRPQQKRNKTRNQMLSALKKGDKVVTIGGQHGTIQEINDQTVTLRVAHNVNVVFDRGAVNAVSSASTEAASSSTSSVELSKEEDK